MRALIEANVSIDSDREKAVQQVARFLRQDRGLVGELMGKVRYPFDLTPDTAGNVQLAIDQLRGMGKLAKEVTPAELDLAGPLEGRGTRPGAHLTRLS